jgi:hypothetical protein
MKIYQVIEVQKNYAIFSKIGTQNSNLNTSAHSEAIWPILVLNCQKCLSTTTTKQIDSDTHVTILASGHYVPPTMQERTSRGPCQKGLETIILFNMDYSSLPDLKI